ncbi:unnamed protein product [Parajaminaea phylloscopi]
MAVADPPQDGQAARNQQPAWHLPQPTDAEPTLVVYNSLTRSKVPFVPMRGRHVTWYNCGPTVYDASHMGHARNYVSQDIMRRILQHLGYTIQFVMNITDIDDKIIVRARQNHLVQEFRSQHPTLTGPLLTQVKEAWSAFFTKTIKKLAPPSPEPGDVSDEAAWEEISRLNQDAKWREATLAKEPKFPMWFTALDRSRQAIIAATMTVVAQDQAASSSTAAAASSEDLIDASVDLLASSLDAAKGGAVTDPSIFRALAARWETAYFDDMKRLGVLAPDQLTRVSEYVPEIVTFTERIITNGFGYSDASGNVWFDTRAFDGAKLSESERHSYAKLAPWSKGNRELLDEGEGSLSTSAATTSGKRSASDFALWKSSKPGEPSWPSPWGAGRPGWHIECSVMATEVLGSRMDVHSGGVDLMFPHHDNELAQSEAHHGCAPWVNYFLHTGHLHIEGLKMSKSLKNFISIDEALDRFTSRQLRLAFLLQSWSSRMDFKQSAMHEVRTAEDRFNSFFATVKAHARTTAAKGPSYSDGLHHYGAGEKALIASLTEAQLAFHRALCDSFDTPTAVAVLLDLVSKANVYEKDSRTATNAGVLTNVGRWVGEMLRMFGLGEGPVREGEIGWGDSVAAGATKGSSEEGASVDKEALLLPYLNLLSNFRSSVRQLARDKNSQPHGELLRLADRLRDEDLVDLGVALEDNDDGTAMLKLVPAEQLRAARDEKLKAVVEKQKRKEEAARKAAELKAEKLRKGKVAPENLFKPKSQGGLAEEGEWKEWDDKGLPTVDGKTGEEISKKKRKAVEKELATHIKLHEEYLAARARGEVE